jgi:uncharacterized membrane protein YeiH
MLKYLSMFTETIAFYVLEYLGIFFFGIAGGLSAVKRKYDVFAVLTISWVTALGGGIIRDVLIGAPPVGLNNWGYVLTAVFAGIITIIFGNKIHKYKKVIVFADSVALGLFAVQGSVKALIFGSTPIAAAIIGTITAVGGGTIRDLLEREAPMIIAKREYYATPTLVGSILSVITFKLHGAFFFQILIILGVSAFRLLALKFGLLVPRTLPKLPKTPKSS